MVEPASSVVGLLGPNGAGKTTAMRTVFGVVEPDTGQVCWNGEAASAADRAGWGYMTQERGLYPDMRVSDQLVYFARLHGLETPPDFTEPDNWNRTHRPNPATTHQI